VVDHTVERGHPGDAPQLIARRPRIVTADRGYGEARVENDLQGARICTGHGVLAHNLVKIAALSG
jgi:IS5 family transposase